MKLGKKVYLIFVKLFSELIFLVCSICRGSMNSTPSFKSKTFGIFDIQLHVNIKVSNKSNFGLTLYELHITEQDHFLQYSLNNIQLEWLVILSI